MEIQAHVGPTQTKVNPVRRGLLTLALIWANFFLPTKGGLGAPPNKEGLIRALWGPPCDCAGGYASTIPTSYTRTTDCGGSTAYLIYEPKTGGGYGQNWRCVTKPRIIPPVQGRPGACPQGCQITDQMHSTCYQETQECTHADGKVYLTAPKPSGTFPPSAQPQDKSSSVGATWLSLLCPPIELDSVYWLLSFLTLTLSLVLNRSHFLVWTILQAVTRGHCNLSHCS